MKYHATTQAPSAGAADVDDDADAATDGLHDDGSTRVVLYQKPAATKAVKWPTAGAAALARIRRAGLTPSRQAWDLLNIALTVMISDAHHRRSASPDGWTREFDLTIPVTEPDLWTSQADTLASALSFLTTDRWQLTFEAGPTVYTPPAAKKGSVLDADCVALLSGGLDSLIGAIDLVEDDRRPLFVSQAVPGDGQKQRDFATAIRSASPTLVLNHNVNTHGLPKEPSQRGRSLIFIAYGVLAATTVQAHRDGGTVPLYLNENGYIAINPPLTPMRLGSLSTRTAHPRYLGEIQAVLDAVGLRVKLDNPYRFKTKGEMMAECASQNLLAKYAADSTSCGRFRRYKYEHCGRCLPCQVRRAAFTRWGKPDGTSYKFSDLGRDDEAHAGFDDVRAVAVAVATANARGFDRWLGAGLSGVPAADRAKMRDMLERGLAELAALHAGPTAL